MNFRNAIFTFLCCVIAISFLILMINPLTKLSIVVTTDNVAYTPTLIIDAGHGGEDGGAVSDNGILEKKVNLIKNHSRFCDNLTGNEFFTALKNL